MGQIFTHTYWLWLLGHFTVKQHPPSNLLFDCRMEDGSMVFCLSGIVTELSKQILLNLAYVCVYLVYSSRATGQASPWGWKQSTCLGLDLCTTQLSFSVFCWVMVRFRGKQGTKMNLYLLRLRSKVLAVIQFPEHIINDGSNFPFPFSSLNRRKEAEKRWEMENSRCCRHQYLVPLENLNTEAMMNYSGVPMAIQIAIITPLRKNKS